MIPDGFEEPFAETKTTSSDTKPTNCRPWDGLQIARDFQDEHHNSYARKNYNHKSISRKKPIQSAHEPFSTFQPTNANVTDSLCLRSSIGQLNSHG